mgnify:CR=1 FL=1
MGGHLYKKGLEMWKKQKIKTRNYCVTLKNYYTLSEMLIFCSIFFFEKLKNSKRYKKICPIFVRFCTDIGPISRRILRIFFHLAIFIAN